MAKQKAEIEKVEQQNAALAVAADVAPWSSPYEDDERGQLLSRVIVHQGDISEKYYGDHEKGSLIDSDTMEEFGQRKFVPLTAYVEYIRWPEKRSGNAQPVYRTRNRDDVPPEDLQWNGDIPPACEIVRNFVVLFDGHEIPMILSFKSSSKKQRLASKTLDKYEMMNAGQGRFRGLYELIVTDEENEKGRWKDLSIRNLGQPDDKLKVMAANWIKALAGKKVVASDDQPPATGGGGAEYNPDADGFV